jgi:ABC-type Mn2+/Zn2+ transport system ATPase subunit
VRDFASLTQWLLQRGISFIGISDKWLQSEITKRENRRVGELSAGQQRRIYVATMITVPMRVLLLDEPTAGISRSFSDQLCALLNEMARLGVAVCLIEHDLSKFAHCISRVVKLEGGKIVS